MEENKWKNLSKNFRVKKLWGKKSFTSLKCNFYDKIISFARKQMDRKFT